MKITNSEIINVGDVSTSGHLRLDSMFNIFQEMAVLHTHKVGLEINNLLESGKTWVLNRVVVQIAKLPKLEETVEISTWSRKIYRFKGLRDYEISAHGIPIIKASSLWVYVDVKKGKPIRVPDDYESRYGVIDNQSTDVDIENIKYEKITSPDYSLRIATRISDYDINGHVNNAVILQYIETGIVRFPNVHNNIDEIQLLFIREIPLHVDDIHVHLQKITSGCLFEIESNSVVFVRGSASIRETP